MEYNLNNDAKTEIILEKSSISNLQKDFSGKQNNNKSKDIDDISINESINNHISDKSDTKEKTNPEYFLNSEVLIEKYNSKCEEHAKINKLYLVSHSYIKIFFFVIMNIITVGIINLCISWFPNLNMVFLYKKVKTIKEAEFVFIIDNLNAYSFIELVKSKENDMNNSGSNSNIKTDANDVRKITDDERNISQTNANNTKAINDSDMIKNKKMFICEDNSKLVNSFINIGMTDSQFQKSSYIYFEFKLFKYVYNSQTRSFHSLYYTINTFSPVKGKQNNTKLNNNTKILEKTTRKKIHCHYANGLINSDIKILKFLFGVCDLHIHLNSIFKLIWNELTDPFYLFQVGSVILWYSNNYSSYATVILVTTILSLGFSVYETRQNLQNIQRMAKYSTEISVIRERKVKEISSKDLVPGDLFIIPEAKITVPCDAILLSGSVILNEALLTGESTPIVKDSLPIDDVGFNYENDKKHIVYNGTKVIQKRGTCLAVVLHTAFDSEKGSLIRSILFPKPIANKFQSESVKYIMIMGLLGALGYCCSVYFLYGTISNIQIILKFLDLITTVVPPALPACLGIGISYAVIRLREKKINCIERNKINLAGMTNIVCFDKTGTLTEDHLDIIGFKRNSLSIKKGFEFQRLQNEFNDLSNTVYERSIDILNKNKIENNNDSNIQQQENKERKESLYKSSYKKEADNELSNNNNNVNNISIEDTQKQESTNNIRPKKKSSTEMMKFEEKQSIMDRMFIECLASCHSLTQVNNELIGDPIDIGMFEKSTWQFIQTEEESDKNDKKNNSNNKENINDIHNIDYYFNLNNNNSIITTNILPKQEKHLQDKLSSILENEGDVDIDEDNILRTHYELAIIRKFNFSSKLQRMTVIAKNLNENEVCLVYSKGSPEKISELCKQETLPYDFKSVLKYYTTQGYRVMAMAGKAMKIDYMTAQSIDRSVIEKNMVFLGLIIIQNKLKEKTIPTLKLLDDCRLKMVMATGDNLLTAIAVARECGLVNKECQVYLCTSTNTTEEVGSKIKSRFKLEWESLADIYQSQEEEHDRNTLVNKVNMSIRNIISKEDGEDSFNLKNNINYNNAYNNNKESIHFLNKIDEDDETNEEDEVHLKEFYKFLEIEEANDNFISSSNNKFASEIEECINNNNNNTNNNNNAKSTFINQSHHSSFASIDVNLDSHPILDDHHDEIIIVTNGSTFEMLYNLAKQYKKTNKKKYKIYFDTFRVILKKGYIFARMSPDQKTLLVETLQEENFNVCMCGDGANDCGALKAATVGISLSLEEASIAAPFTSQIPDISCLKDLFLESKASVVTSFQCFKYNMMFSMVQFISVVLLNIIGSYITDNQFLASDLFVIFPLALLLARTETSDKLNRHYPVSSLFSVSIISSIFLQTIVFLVFQLGIWLILINTSSFIPDTCKFEGKYFDAMPCTENSVSFLFNFNNLLILSSFYCRLFLLSPYSSILLRVL